MSNQPRFIINADNAVTDTQTGLIWSRDTVAIGVDKENAHKAIAALGEGWRMPLRHEMESILDLTRYEPAIDTESFPDTKSRAYWTDTPCAFDASCFWVVDFFYGGSVLDYPRASDACVRPVRSVPASQ